jgi:hypothetical protein
MKVTANVELEQQESWQIRKSIYEYVSTLEQ